MQLFEENSEVPENDIGPEAKFVGKSKKISRIPVTTILKKNTAVLVQYTIDGKRQRGIVRHDWIISEKSGRSTVNYVEESNLELAMPFGIDWTVVGDVTISAEKITESLRNAGIWTLQDFEKNPDKVLKAACASSTEIIANIQAVIRDFKNEEI